MFSSCVSGGSYVVKILIDVIFGIGNSNNEFFRNGDIVEGMFDGVDDRSMFDD